MRVCQLFVNKIIKVNTMREAHQKLIEIVKLIENNYGRDKITLNLYICVNVRTILGLYILSGIFPLNT